MLIIPTNKLSFWVFVTGAYLLLFLAGCTSSTDLPQLSGDVYGKVFVPTTEGPHPAVLVLHGSGGMRPVYLKEAQLLADNGYVALVLDYYAEIENPGYTQGRRLENWETWMDRIESAIVYLRSLPEVDGERVALVGFSQGAALAIFAAAEDGEIKAVADFFGPRVDGWYVEDRIGYKPESLDAVLGDLPPMIIFHGTMDLTVPVSSSRKLNDALKERGKVVELHIYDGAGHAFNDPEGFFRSNPKAAEDAQAKLIGFFDRYLKDGGDGFSTQFRTARKRPLYSLVEFGRSEFYNGHKADYEEELTARPLPGLDLTASAEWENVDLPGGRFITRLYIGRVDYGFTNRHALNLFGQYDNESNGVGFQARFRWTPRPGNDLFLGYVHNWVDTLDTFSGRRNWQTAGNESTIKGTMSFRFQVLPRDD